MTDTAQASPMRVNPVAAIADDLATYLWGKGYGRNCVNCDRWKPKEQQCGLYNALPPAEVIVTGCKDHTDLIPF